MIRKRVSKSGTRYQALPYVRGVGRVNAGTYATRTEARDAVRRREAEAVTVLSGAESVGEFALRWIEQYPRPKASTQAEAATTARRIANDHEPVRDGNRVIVMPKLRMSEVTRPLARAYAMNRPAYIHKVIRAMFSDAVNDGIVATNPFAGLRLAQSRGRKDIKALTQDELHALARAAREVYPRYPAFAAMILFGGYTGLRPGEMLALEWDDLRDGMVDVNKRLYAGAVDSPKTRTSVRLAVVADQAAEALRSMPRSVASKRVFLTPRGKEFRDTGTFSRDFRKVYEHFEDGIPAARARELREARGGTAMVPHELRHFCATFLLERGVSLEDVALQLGNSAKEVEQTYGHPSRESARARLRRAFEVEAVPRLRQAREERA